MHQAAEETKLKDEIELEEERVAFLTIGEGKKRQIRRMFGALGNQVTALHRSSTENMALSDFDLAPGEFIEVRRRDIVDLIYQPSI